jgi:hypothetical protein
MEALWSWYMWMWVLQIDLKRPALDRERRLGKTEGLLGMCLGTDTVVAT